MFITPGALEVVLRLVSLTSLGWSSDTPAMAESTLVRSEVSADMLTEMDWVELRVNFFTTRGQYG